MFYSPQILENEWWPPMIPVWSRGTTWGRACWSCRAKTLAVMCGFGFASQKKNSGLKFLKNSIIIWKAWRDLLHACVREVSKKFKKKIITGIKTWNSHFWELCKSWINAAEAQGFSESIVCSRLELQPVQSCVIRLRNLIDLSELVQHCERRPPSGGSDAA